MAENNDKELDIEKDLYKVTLLCENCDNKRLFAIPKGTAVANVLHELKCKNCQCTATLRKV